LYEKLVASYNKEYAMNVDENGIH